MLIFSVFKTLTDQEVTVELKNDLSITGVLKSVDQFLNLRLDAIKVHDEARHPHMMAVKNCFIRGSVTLLARRRPIKPNGDSWAIDLDAGIYKLIQIQLYKSKEIMDPDSEETM
ncbi:hypothetical protein OPQ81_005964 [Rhizoctonia solani]|nr:hypothetical protein OPQ81_005964 [Rhizoctonia solani]